MKAIVQDTYGSPDVLGLRDLPTPTPQDDEVLVRVHAASVNAADWHLMRGTPFFIRLMLGGLRRPNVKTPGVDIAGRVEAVGRAVRRFRPGDDVFGDLSEDGFGGFAECVCVPERALAPKPRRLSFEEAAAVPVAGLAALQGLRDKGHIQSGQEVLINGASGGVGTFAVQIARAHGATVTAVCSPEKQDVVRALGADRVVDYTRVDITQAEERYDLILDAAAYRSPRDYLRVLRPDGTYVLVGGATARLFQAGLLSPWIGMTTGKTVAILMAEPNPTDLEALTDLVDSGAVTPVIGRRYALSEVPEAIRDLEAGRIRGKGVIAVIPSDARGGLDASASESTSSAAASRSDARGRDKPAPA